MRSRPRRRDAQPGPRPRIPPVPAGSEARPWAGRAQNAGHSSRGWRVFLLCAYFPAYLLIDWASYVYPVVPLGITPWNPPAGLSLALLLWMGARHWPALFVAALAADLLVRGAPANLGVSTAAAGIIAAGYGIAARILLRISGSRTTLESTRDLVAFVIVTVVASFTVAASFVGLYAAIGMVARPDIAIDVLKYWVGDLNGILVLTPALLCLSRISSQRMPSGRFVSLEIGMQAVALAAGLYLIFAFAGQYPYRSFYVLFLPLIWISARWGLGGAALAQLAIQLGLIVGVQLADYRSATFVQLQLLMSGLCVTGLTLGGMASHRTRLQLALQQKQADLSRAQQLASAGEVTSALAHQLNQPMTALNSYLAACRMLLRATPMDAQRLDELMDKAAAQAQRAGDVVRGLRDFYRRGITRSESTPVAHLVENVSEVLQSQARRRGVAVETRHADPGALVHVDRLQIENALQNVVTNAIDAVAERGGPDGWIEIGTSQGLGRVEIRVRDSGGGIASDMSDGLFEPFFTSKPDGMGMGLAIARSLVRANHGELTLERSDPSGACFLLTLPERPDGRPTPP